MAQLIVRNIEKEVVLKLKQKAAREGISMEEELRRILRKSVGRKTAKPKMSFKDFLLTVPDFGDPDALRSKDMPREIDFD
jgi:hypothetical protein